MRLQRCCRVGWMLMGTLAGCDDDPASREAADRAAYLDAIETTDLEEALDGCLEVGDPTLRGECAVAVAGAAARGGQEALAWRACEALEPGIWRDECGFSVVDGLGIEGPPAWELCERAGQYRPFCVGHSVTRTFAGFKDLPLAVGQEQELYAELELRMGKLGPPLNLHHRQTVIDTAAARHIAARWGPDRPFDQAECGAAPRDLCLRAYTETMRTQISSVDRGAVCEEPVTAERVAALGGTSWKPGSESVPLEGWRALCHPWKAEGR